MDLTTILMISILVGIGVIILRKKETVADPTVIAENARLKAEVSQKDQYIGELKSELQKETTKKDELTGKGKVQYAENANLKAENSILLKDVSTFKATEGSRKKEFEEGIQKVANAETALKQERDRAIREDEAKKEKEKEERNRIWAEHETRVKSILSELCKSPQYSFPYWDNTNPPIEFGGRFKPDSLVEFLDQYVIFDAKKSESDMQGYINTQVKTTVEKINSNPKVFKWVFFVIPSESMKSVKKYWHHEQGYEFFVLSPEALDIVLTTFKKIKSYEIAQKLDPQDRENIVNIIASFDQHINLRNTYDIIASKMGVDVLKKIGVLKNDLKDEISLKKNNIRTPNFAPTEVQSLMLNTESQENAMEEIISPKPEIAPENVKIIKRISKK